MYSGEIMEQLNIEELIKRPENEELEFKTHMPNKHLIAANAAAFANTNGGQLIIGVREGGQVIGIKDIEKARKTVEQAIQTVSPVLKPNIEIVPIQGKSILVAAIPRGNQSPYIVGGRVLQRIGDKLTDVRAETLYSNIEKRTTTNDDLRVEIQHLAGTIEELTKEVASARSWKSKIPTILISGFVGALLSLLLSLVYGAYQYNRP